MRNRTYITAQGPIYSKGSLIKENREQVIILGNAYGVMPYQEPLAEALAQEGFETFWFAFSGQPGSFSGQFSIRNGVQDLSEAIHFVRSRAINSAHPMYIVSHCASGLITMEYLARSCNSPINKVAIYGLLAEPERLRNGAYKRLGKAGVDVGLTDWDWNYCPEHVAPLIDVPILFCHADDAVNRRRSLPHELERVASLVPGSDVQIFPEGYDSNIPNVAVSYSKTKVSCKNLSTKILLTTILSV